MIYGEQNIEVSVYQGVWCCVYKEVLYCVYKEYCVVSTRKYSVVSTREYCVVSVGSSLVCRECCVVSSHTQVYEHTTCPCP